MRKICKIKFSKTEKTGNLEAAVLKLHKFYHFMILLKNAIKIFAVAKLPQPAELLKSLNDRQFHILLKFKELKEPIQFELNYHMSINNCQAIQKSCIDRKSNAWFTLGPESKILVSLGRSRFQIT